MAATYAIIAKVYVAALHLLLGVENTNMVGFLFVQILELKSVFLFAARTERYQHLDSEEEEDTNDDDHMKIRQFSSCSPRFSKV